MLSNSSLICIARDALISYKVSLSSSLSSTCSRDEAVSSSALLISSSLTFISFVAISIVSSIGSTCSLVDSQSVEVLTPSCFGTSLTV